MLSQKFAASSSAITATLRGVYRFSFNLRPSNWLPRVALFQDLQHSMQLLAKVVTQPGGFIDINASEYRWELQAHHRKLLAAKKQLHRIMGTLRHSMRPVTHRLFASIAQLSDLEKLVESERWQFVTDAWFKWLLKEQDEGWDVLLREDSKLGREFFEVFIRTAISNWVFKNLKGCC